MTEQEQMITEALDKFTAGMSDKQKAIARRIYGDASLMVLRRIPEWILSGSNADDCMTAAIAGLEAFATVGKFAQQLAEDRVRKMVKEALGDI